MGRSGLLAPFDIGGERVAAPRPRGRSSSRERDQAVEAGVHPWQRRAASLLASLVQAGGLVSVAMLFDFNPRVPWRRAADAVYTVLAVPVAPSVFIAVALLVLGAALRRRKRAALYTLWVLQALQLAGLLFLRARRELLDPELIFDPNAGLRHAHPLVMLGLMLACAAVLVVMVALRPAFPARAAPGFLARSLGVLAVGLTLASAVGFGLTEAFPGTLTGPGEKLAWSVNQATGRLVVLGHLGLFDHGPDWVSVIIGALAAAVAFAAVHGFFASARGRRLMTEREELTLRELLVRHGHDDSLGYFATRRDKSVAFAPGGRSAVCYRVLGGVSLASGDPIGDRSSWPEAVRAWRAEAIRYGWIPGVLGAGKAGARAYAAGGLQVRELGDEAILETTEFAGSGRDHRAVARAAAKVARAGYSSLVRRQAEIDDGELADLGTAAEAWRDGTTERGFSMALGRIGDRSDDRSVIATAYAPDGRLAGVLSFVPWGSDGLSLDVMRRDRDAINGLTEYQVVQVVAAAGGLGIRRVSLNFAMFRAVFEQGEQIGAGPVLRAWRVVLELFSHIWQLESLYRANAKYAPKWEPRFLCYPSARALPRVSIVAGMAEGFVPSWRGRAAARQPAAGWEFRAAVEGIDERPAGLAPARRAPSEQMRVRLAKATRLAETGVGPYPDAPERTERIAAVRAAYPDLAPDTHTGARVSIAGRLVAVRDHGGLCFADLQAFDARLQVMLTAHDTGPESIDRWKDVVDLGDQIAVTGEVVTTRTGELTISARDWQVTAKCLHPLPGRAQAGARGPRSRALELIRDPAARSILTARSEVIRAVREFLHQRGYLEVDTPTLVPVHGGAAARPFVTHSNAGDRRLYLRIAPELALKRLCVAGVDRLFELGRNFRNEGIDATHNPEFTMLEAYQAYGDQATMRTLATELIQHATHAVHGQAVVRRGGSNGETHPVDIDGQWPVVGVYQALSTALRITVTPDTDPTRLRAACQTAGIRTAPEATHAELVLRAYEQLVEPATERPTFYIDFPAETTPLARPQTREPRLACRWDLVADGIEIATAYSELTDPRLQRRRLEAQSHKKAGGDPEAMELDEDFLHTLEHGMPPTGGLGIGIDRLIMMLTGTTIQQTITFPQHRHG
jgi:lysyl-tRNA synthetase class 2